MNKIHSIQNPRFKAWRKLHTTKGRKQQKAYLIEGDHLIEEAIQSNAPLQIIILSEDHGGAFNQFDGEIVHITNAMARQLSQTTSNQGVFGIVSYPDQDPVPALPLGNRYLLLDRIQDPGNLGTMIRTADAANYDAIVLGTGTVDVYNDKVIRSTQGSLWHLPIISMPLEDAIEELNKREIPVYATELNHQARSYREISPPNQLALILGNEGSGVKAKYVQASDGAIYIPMPGSAESLNVSVAAGILMFYFIEN